MVSLVLPVPHVTSGTWAETLDTALGQLETAVNAAVVQDTLVFNAKNHGVVGDNVTDDSAAILNFVALADSTNGGILYFPPSTYLCNTATAGVILKIANKQQLTICGAGKSTIFRTTTATATDFLRLETCTRATVRDLFIQVAGTANVTNAFHVTTSDPGSAHQTFVENVTVYNMGRTFRSLYDVATTTGSAVVTSATAAFAAGDVGGAVGLNQAIGPLNTTIASVATVTGTVNNGGTVTAVQTTLPLTAPLSGVPNSSYTIKVDSEIMLVTAGFQTSTLTVKRTYGSTSSVASTHADGSTVTTYTATLNATATATRVPTVMLVQTPASAVMVNGIVLGGDHPGSSSVDLASVSLIGCTVNGAIGSAFQSGNGTAGNVLSNYATGCEAALSLYGLFLNGGGLGLRGGNFSTNGIDVKIGQYCSQPVSVHALRSENCGLLYENSLSTTAAMPVTFMDVMADVFYAPDGVVMRHQGDANLTIISGQLLSWQQGQGVQIVCNSSSNAEPASLVALNVVSNGGNTNLMPTSAGNLRVYSFGGGRVNSSGHLIPNFDAQRIDGPVAIATSAQTLASNGAVTIDASQGDALITLQANATSSSITNPTIGQKLDITWIQDATGARTYAWPANCKFAGSAPADTTASKRSSVTFRYDGTNWNEKARAVAVG